MTSPFPRSTSRGRVILLAVTLVSGAVLSCTLLGPGTAIPTSSQVTQPTVANGWQPATDAQPPTDTIPEPTQDQVPASTPTTSPTMPPQTVVGLAEYEVQHQVVLTNNGPGSTSRVLLWVALIRDLEPYQRVTSTEINPAQYAIESDEHGNQYARFEFGPMEVGESAAAVISQRVTVNELDFDLGVCEGEVLSAFTDPELYIESGATEIQALASNLAEGKTTTCEKVRSFYDYVGSNLRYAGYIPEDLGALAALETKEGDCTDFADLLMALTRADGVPARFLEGVTCCTTGEHYNPGDIKHDWLEVYLPGVGWAPMDPTWGRSSASRDDYFAAMSPDHIVVTRGRNLSKLGNYHYMYYQWWWDAAAASMTADENWSVVRTNE